MNKTLLALVLVLAGMSAGAEAKQYGDWTVPDARIPDSNVYTAMTRSEKYDNSGLALMATAGATGGCAWELGVYYWGIQADEGRVNFTMRIDNHRPWSVDATLRISRDAMWVSFPFHDPDLIAEFLGGKTLLVQNVSEIDRFSLKGSTAAAGALISECEAGARSAPDSHEDSAASDDEPERIQFGKGEITHTWHGAVRNGEKHFRLWLGRGQKVRVGGPDVYSWAILTKDGLSVPCDGPSGSCNPGDRSVFLPYSGDYEIATNYRSASGHDITVSFETW